MGCGCRKASTVSKSKDFCSSLGLVSPVTLVDRPGTGLGIEIQVPDGRRMDLREAMALWRCNVATTGVRVAEAALSSLQRTSLRQETLKPILGRTIALNLLRERLDAASR